MSRTYKDAIRCRHDLHADAPYWKYRWWMNHGSKRSSAAIRQKHNKQFRAKVKHALKNGKELPRWKRDLAWIYW